MYQMKIFILLAVLSMISCSARHEEVPTKKTPPKVLPEIGIRPSIQVSVYHSRKIVLELIKRARQQMNAGKLENAFSTLERAVKIDPSDPVPWHILAEIQLKQNQA